MQFKQTQTNFEADNDCENKKLESIENRSRGRPRKNLPQLKTLKKPFNTKFNKINSIKKSMGREKNNNLNKVTPEKSEWLLRLRGSNPVQKYICTNAGCDRVFEKKESLNRHFKICGIQPPFKCAYCEHYSHYKINIIWHQHKSHKNEKFKVFYLENEKLVEC